MTDSLLQFIQNINHAYLYPVLFLSAVLENLIPPIPGDTVTLFGAYLVGIGQLNLWGVFAVTGLGNFVGFMGLFFLARFLEREFFLGREVRFFPAERLLQAEQWFNKFGYIVILFNRFLSGARSVISIVSGFSKLKAGRVAFCSLLSCAVWNGILVYSGYTAGKNWETIALFLKQYNKVMFMIIIAAVAIYVLRKRIGQRR